MVQAETEWDGRKSINSGYVRKWLGAINHYRNETLVLKAARGDGCINVPEGSGPHNLQQHKKYSNKTTAGYDSTKLTRVNLVGFTVQNYKMCITPNRNDKQCINILPSNSQKNLSNGRKRLSDILKLMFKARSVTLIIFQSIAPELD